jgi:dTDP-4-amino-4,6-dideoxygalactose transaminase
MPSMQVPFFRPDLGDAEVAEVTAVLRGGWLTSGPLVRRFEQEFAAAVGAAHAVAVNSCTAALHLAVAGLGLNARQAVLVPTMTFAATAEVVHYQGAVPLLVDCDPVTGNVDLKDAARKLEQLRTGDLPPSVPPEAAVVGLIPVHVGGLMLDIERVQDFCRGHRLWLVEDAAHAFPAAWRPGPGQPWQRCGEQTAQVSCFSFYANKTITTGEGGMAVTDDPELAERMRLLSLHGLSHDAWGRYADGGSWDYRIVAPGYKYNLTDLAAAIGVHQLARAEAMRCRRETIAKAYRDALADVAEIELPPADDNRLHAWHLFPIRLRTDRLAIPRNAFVQQLKQAGVGCSVHWRPLHLHPYYQERFGWRPEHFPAATALWQRLVSLPLFPGMTEDQVRYVADTVKGICARNRPRGVHCSPLAPLGRGVGGEGEGLAKASSLTSDPSPQRGEGSGGFPVRPAAPYPEELTGP